MATLRILASVLLFISVLFWPYWISIILGLAFISLFSFYVEAIFLFLLSDLMFGAREPKLFHIVGISFVITVICFVLIELIKKKLRFNTL